MRVGFLDASISYDQIGRRLLSNARDTRNIVRRIPHQCLDIDELNRCDLVTLLDIRRIVVLDLGSGAFRLWDTDLDVICRKLQKIAVPGNHGNHKSFLFAPFRDRSDDIIRLIAFFFDDPHAHCL